MKLNKILQTTLILGTVAFSLLMLIYAYQGWFTRYMADDYCNAVLFANNAEKGLINRYISGFGGNRYSNIWLVGVSEFLGGIKTIPYLPAFHISAWIIGLIGLMTEIKKLLKTDWSFWMIVFLGLSIAFFTLIQAPNLYQIVYWRSSMSTHFAPVVYGTLLIAYLARQSNDAARENLPTSSYVIAFVFAFIVGGFSEPADAVQITVLILTLAAVWYFGKTPTRERLLKLFSWTLAAALLSLIVMVISPANARRLGSDPPGLMLLIHDSFLYGYIFIQKTFSELPLPSLLSALMPALLMTLHPRAELSNAQKRNIWILIPVILFLSYLLIVASFSPSVLGQGYPVERVRFYARLIMTLGLMIDGALLGVLFAQKITRPVFQWGLLIMFFAVGVIYPFRAAVSAYREIPKYQLRAQKWDQRHALIQDHVANGQTKLIVIQFDGVDGTKELDTYPTHWVNKCAAKYYRVKSISAFPDK